MSKTTEINLILDNNLVETEEKINEENLVTYINDLSLPCSIRLKALDMYYEKEGNDNTIDIINKLTTMYGISGTKILREYLSEICQNSHISVLLKIISAMGIYEYNETDDLGYNCINFVYSQINETISTPYKIDLVKILMKNIKYREQTQKYFFDIITNSKLDINFIYKFILSLENNKKSEEEKNFKFFIFQGSKYIIFSDERPERFRILSAQNLLQNFSEIMEQEEIEKIQSVLLSFAENKELEYNVRADATDIILKLGTPENKIRAQEIINILGNENNKTDNIYNNMQNVHIKEVEDSVTQILESLQKNRIMLVNNENINISYVEKEITELAKDMDIEKINKIKLSLNRIKLDRSLYSRYNCRLEYIILQIWTYISNNKSVDEMKKRLLEELVDMSGTCSSGFAARLVNTITGFGDFNISISWRDQIVSNLAGRLNARIRTMDNLRLQEKILSQLTLDAKNYDERKHFLKFFRENISEIREEMFQEFKKYIFDTDFDIYFRHAISFYEMGEFN